MGFLSDGVDGGPERSAGGTVSADAVFGGIMEAFLPALQGERARSDKRLNDPRFADVTNAFRNLLGGPGLTGELQQSALANTFGARQSAVQNARTTATRGGLAFGGGAAAIAGRAGQDAFSQQQAALSSALVQGRQTDFQGQLQAAGGLSGAALGELGLRHQQEQQFDLSVLQSLLNMRTNLAVEGLRGDRARQDRTAQGTANIFDNLNPFG